MTRTRASALGLVLALASAGAQAGEFVVLSRYSEVQFQSVGLGIAGGEHLSVETDPAATFDDGHEGEGWYVEPGGATNTGMWSVRQRSTIAPDVISADLSQSATTGTDYGSPAIFQDTTFAITFMVSFATTVQLNGAVLTEPWPSDNWSRVTLLRDVTTLFSSDWDSFPYVVELQPFTTYRLAVDVYGGILFDATTVTSAVATLSVVSDTDTDADGLADADDNCTLVPNADQRDTNGDGYGNACDPDLDDDGTVNFVDAGLMKAVFFSADPDADLDGNGSVNFVDLGVLKGWFFLPPGPSGLVQ